MYGTFLSRVYAWWGVCDRASVVGSFFSTITFGGTASRVFQCIGLDVVFPYHSNARLVACHPFLCPGSAGLPLVITLRATALPSLGQAGQTGPSFPTRLRGPPLQGW